MGVFDLATSLLCRMSLEQIHTNQSAEQFVLIREIREIRGKPQN